MHRDNDGIVDPKGEHALRPARRKFGMMAAALLAGRAVPGMAQAVGAPATVQRIDVHHHFLPAVFRETMGEVAIGAPAPNRIAPQWKIEDSLGVMDRQGITTAVVSAPPLWMPEMAKTRRLTRACNEFSAQMVADHPTRFGAFAALPLPDATAALKEIQYSLDTLKADGIGLMTNYDDRYLGHADFVPVFDELNRRKAVVYVHPTSCSCNRGLLPDEPDSLIEFPHDTTRTVASLMFSGTFNRCPDIRFIFSHAGGTVPFLATRMAILGAQDKGLARHVPQGVMPILRGLYYDTAISANPISMAALLKLVTPANVLLGTDFPFVPEHGMQATLAGLRDVGFSAGELRAVEGGNAARLLDRVARDGARTPAG
ncbi:amidohydrolase family protein [Burkholderia sp. S171]|uniref:amidohydrolase family protein n=1 Tax=Burkholderia sp. S171 TaxID=1641860 RepID=UPI00131B72D8|nr:amidohydrolase family protein [Burkholderia sp. S171]